eukprot:15348357-Ditylum_brightwellii.AAC.1
MKGDGFLRTCRNSVHCPHVKASSTAILKSYFQIMQLKKLSSTRIAHQSVLKEDNVKHFKTV